MHKESIKLGLMPPLTGVVGIYGPEILRAGLIACQEINNNGGVLGRQLEIVVEDDGSMPESSVAAAEKLIDTHHCSAIIGNLLSNSRIAVAYSVAEPRKIPYLNFSFYEGSILSRYFFHYAALPNQQIDRMIPYMRERFGPRFFFAGNNYEWPRGSIDAAKLSLKLSGGEIVGEQYCPIGVDDESIEQLLDQVETESPDVFVPYFAGIDQVKLLTRFTERGLKNHIAVVMGHFDEMMASTLSPEVREGFYSSNTYFMSVKSEENQRYLEQLKKHPGITGIWPHGNGILTNFGEGAYICVKAFAAAANEAGSLDAEVLVDTLKTTSVNAPQGLVVMNPDHHHARVNSYLTRCRKDGEFEIVTNFGAMEPVLPERYEHQKIGDRSTLEDGVRLQARILEQLSEAVLLVGSKDNRIIYSNSGAERMFGYDKGQMRFLNIDCLQSLDEENSRQHLLTIISILKSKGEWHGEIETLKKDGSPIWCSTSVSSFTHHDPAYGEVWLWVLNDISERKRIEDTLKIYHSQLKGLVDERTRQLQQSESRLTQVLSSSPVVIYTSTTHGQYPITFISENVNNIFGFRPEQFLDDPSFWINGIHPDDAPRVLKEREKLLEHGSHAHEYRFRQANGDYIWIQDELKVKYNESGEPVEIIGYWADITDRKRAEDTLHAKSEQLETVISSAALVLWSTDDKGNFTLSEGKALENMGLTPGEVVGKSVFEVYKDFPEILTASSRVLKGESFVLETEVANRYYESHYTPRMNNENKVVGSLGVAIDVTERKKFELEMIAAKQEAERANKAKTEFLSSMSHELRTPMNAIIGFSQLLENDLDLTYEQRDNVHEILKGGNHLLDLINEVLDLAKVESGHIDLSIESVELSPLIIECMSMIDTLAVKRNIVLEVNGVVGVLVKADRFRLKQALINLLSNAIKYNRLNGRVTLDVRKPNATHVRISVMDTGFGIPQERLSELFLPFSRLNAKNSDIEGTGIGLSLTQRIVELMQGSVGIESKPEIGSTFWIDLPVANEVKTEQRTASKYDYKKVEPRADASKHTVLYIEDNPANLKLMEQLMKRQEQVTLLAAHTPELGIELAKAHKPGLILLDINLPGMSGYELLSVFKSDAQLKTIPIIAITANAMPKDIERGKRAGFDDYITKPINVIKLYEAINSFLCK